MHSGVVGPSNPAMLSPETKEEIAAFVRLAFLDEDRLIEIFCEEMYEPGELEPSEVSAAIDLELTKWKEEKKSWPKVTDWDRLDAAFAAINKRGVIAMHNAGYTQSDGRDQGDGTAVELFRSLRFAESRGKLRPNRRSRRTPRSPCSRATDCSRRPTSRAG